jgi:hypothetical protein
MMPFRVRGVGRKLGSGLCRAADFPLSFPYLVVAATHINSRRYLNFIQWNRRRKTFPVACQRPRMPLSTTFTVLCG